MSRKLGIRAVGHLLACGAGLAAGAYTAYVGTTWYRYGRVARAVGDEEDPLLDRFMPTYEAVERHHVLVAAPAEITFAAACELDLQQSAIIRAIFTGRELILGGDPEDPKRPRGLLAWVKALGWGVLAEVPGREIVVGGVTQPWKANPVFRALPSDRFAAFNEPDYAKIVWTLRADSIGNGGSVARTETRVMTTDPVAREKFRRYWSAFSPGIVLIRRMALRLVRAEAEGRVRDGRPMTTDRLDLVSAGDLDAEC